MSREIGRNETYPKRLVTGLLWLGMGIGNDGGNEGSMVQRIA